MLSQPVISTINHLLEQGSWAMPRLAQFKGKVVRLNIAPFSLACSIQEDGSLKETASDASPDVILEVAPSLLPRLALQDDTAYDAIGKTGDAALAEEIIFLARNLRWDAAEDISRFTGDIAAERIVQFAQHGQKVVKDAALNLSQAAAEYMTEEKPLLAKPVQISDFSLQVNELRAEVEKLEQRIKQLRRD